VHAVENGDRRASGPDAGELVLQVIEGRLHPLADFGLEHYDVGNDLYQRMLDRRMTYPLPAQANTLDEAQEAKLDSSAALMLAPGMRILDIGCGWGAVFAAEKYAPKSSGSPSRGNRRRWRELCADCRSRSGSRIPRHRGHVRSRGVHRDGTCRTEELRDLLRVARSPRAGRIFLLHTIGTNTPHTPDPWARRYIFPNSMVPSMRQLVGASEAIFDVADWHNFGPDYDRTLMAWWRNFEAAWPQLRTRYDGRFYRMWRYYLMSCAGAFRARTLQLSQIVLSRGDEARLSIGSIVCASRSETC
jgi:cyclopropane-fatty-acyl-phospholipid synthase